MFGVLLSLSYALTGARPDSVGLCVRDAITRAALPGASVSVTPDIAGPSFEAITIDACVTIPVGAVRVQRAGYRARTFTVPAVVGAAPASLTEDNARGIEVVVLLQSLIAAPDSNGQLLTTQQVKASRNAPPNADGSRLSYSMNVNDARALGVATTTALVAALPFTSTRSAHGETGLSLRGARREQVVITLDGVPLNDPSTGMADISDIPLVAIGSATVVPGADPIGAGSGAGGGVLALESAASKVVSMRVGSFGTVSLEGAWFATAGKLLWRGSASHQQAANDFPFLNTSGADVVGIRERRVNNDDRHDALSVGVIGRVAQLSLLASSSDRGMVGPENVRTYDEDRSRTDRLLLRAQLAAHSVQLSAGIRTLSLAYRDPSRPVLNSSAHATAGDADARGRLGVFAWRVGGGGDEISATGGIHQSRGRAFASTDYMSRFNAGSVALGARVDAIGSYGAIPSLSASVERTLLGVAPVSVADGADTNLATDRRSSSSRLSVGARVAQAVRVPTLYDLYFSSPQRLYVRTLRPERVAVDAELHARADLASRVGVWSWQGTLVARDTRDAIIWFPGNFGWSPANVGIERLRGAESRVQWRRAIARVALDASVWGTLYDTQLTSGNLRIPTPYVPNLAGGALLRADALATTVNVNVRSMGRRPFTAGPRDPAFELDATTVCDFAIARRVSLPAPLRATEALVSLSIENALDRIWQSVRGYPSPGRSWAITITLRHQSSSNSPLHSTSHANP